jgi:hypothetical protein
MIEKNDGGREMTVSAIRRRFDGGSWDHADLEYLYRRAEAANQLGEAIRHWEDAHGGKRPNLAEEKELYKATMALLIATSR